MTLRFHITRRHAFQQLGLLVGGAFLGNAARTAGPAFDASVPGELTDAVADLLQHPQSAAIIGEAYLALVDHENSAAELSRRLLQGIATSKERIDARILLERIRSDFAEGDVVKLDGWLLSRTEARICALYALLEAA